MTITTRFNIGDRVRVLDRSKDPLALPGPAWTVRQIRIQTLVEGAVILTEYRTIYSTGRHSPWRAERFLVRA